MNLKESKKEKLPLDFLTSTVSHGWEEIGNLKASISGIKETFTDTKKIEDILQDLVDAYLVCVGQLELYMDKKDYIDAPEELELKESLNESNEAEAEPFEAKKFEDNNKTEIFTELPDYKVEVEQKGDKIEIELEPTATIEKEDTEEDEIKKNEIEPEEIKDEEKFEVGGPEVATPAKNEPFEFFTDFDDPEPNEEADNAVHAWLNR